jgi:hypothetical protein
MAMDPALEAALIQMAFTGIEDIVKALATAKSGAMTSDELKQTITTTVDNTVAKLTADLATNDAMADAEVKKRFPGQ